MYVQLATLDELREAAGVKKAGAEGPIDDSLIPPLVVLRLEPEDLGVRPIPVLGALGQVGGWLTLGHTWSHMVTQI
jgi:hypothetical protein